MAVLPPDPVYILRSSEMDNVNSLFFRNGDHLFAGTLKGEIHLWDLATNRGIFKLLTGTSEPVLAMHHTEDLLISQSRKNLIKIWNLTNSGYKAVTEIPENNNVGFCRMEITSDRKSLVIPINTNDISLYNLDGFQQQMTLSLNSDEDMKGLGMIMCMKCLNINGQFYILAVYESGDFLTWDLRCNKVINRRRLEEDGPTLTVDYDLKTNRGIYGGTGNKISVFNYNLSTMEIYKKQDITIKNPGIDCVRIRADCKVFATGGWDGHIRIFSWKSLRPLAVLTDHKDAVMDVAYSGTPVTMYKAPIMAAGGKDGQISLWDIYN